MGRVSLEDFYGPAAKRFTPRRPARTRVVSASRLGDLPLTDEGKAQLQAAMSATIAALRSAIASGRDAANNVGIITSLTTDIKSQVLYQLGQMENLIQSRLVDQQGAVLSGDLGIDKWQASASAIKDGIKAQLDELQAGSASGVLAQNFADQMAQIEAAAKKVIQQVADTGKTLATFSILGALAIGGLALWIFLPVIRGSAQAYLTAPTRLLPPQGGQPVGGYRRKRRKRHG